MPENRQAMTDYLEPANVEGEAAQIGRDPREMTRGGPHNADYVGGSKVQA
jgi:hypothetical protein